MRRGRGNLKKKQLPEGSHPLRPAQSPTGHLRPREELSQGHPFAGARQWQPCMSVREASTGHAAGTARSHPLRHPARTPRQREGDTPPTLSRATRAGWRLGLAWTSLGHWH